MLYLEEIRIDRNKIAHATAEEIKGKTLKVIFKNIIDNSKNLEVNNDYIRKFEEKIKYVFLNL
ncbi:hypothetical protein KY347_03990 [Candidatus Woesearchaeota archaeon]|nr:hypothetical protein [Candidatus Woesearchaeota archaeon]